MEQTGPGQDDSCKDLAVGMVLYPGFTLLDLAGPQAALGLLGDAAIREGVRIAQSHRSAKRRAAATPR